MKAAIIKTAKHKWEIDDVVEILPYDHVFSAKELSMFAIIDIEDSEVDLIRIAISEYMDQHRSIGGNADDKDIRMSYKNGKLNLKIKDRIGS